MPPWWKRPPGPIDPESLWLAYLSGWVAAVYGPSVMLPRGRVERELREALVREIYAFIYRGPA